MLCNFAHYIGKNLLHWLIILYSLPEPDDCGCSILVSLSFSSGFSNFSEIRADELARIGDLAGADELAQIGDLAGADELARIGDLAEADTLVPVT